jgi:hypothetical protein
MKKPAIDKVETANSKLAHGAIRGEPKTFCGRKITAVAKGPFDVSGSTSCVRCIGTVTKMSRKET